MPNTSDKKSLLTILSVAFFIILITTLITFFASGYQLNFQKGPVIKATGLLSATSKPKSASVYINDQLVTATDDTINLPPGSYTIKIVKDGYLPWQKTVQIKPEVVYLTDAFLYRSVTEIKPITLSGAINPAVSPDGNKIVYAVANASAAKDNGLYLLETYQSPLPLSRSIPPKLLSASAPSLDWSVFTFEFSPNSKSLIATNPQIKISYLLPLDSPITAKNMFDISSQIAAIKKDWLSQEAEIITTNLARLPMALQSVVATSSAKQLQISSGETKILYLANTTTRLPAIVTTPLISFSNQPQTRQIEKGNYYTYDLQTDSNYLVGNSQSVANLTWLPDSNNLIFVEDNQIRIIETDSTNKQTLYGGSFNPQIVVPWFDGNKIVTLASAYAGSPENLYSISIR
ncbi:MAG: PEGA domain-containing protein [Candidatus Shapirobacteria bacterium]|jgi:hypothetical protein